LKTLPRRLDNNRLASANGESAVSESQSNCMNPYKKAALLLIRLVASGLMLFGVINIALYLMKSFLNRSDVPTGRCLAMGIPIAIGLVILVKSSAIAGRLTQDLDE
jgi:hypothetical protein